MKLVFKRSSCTILATSMNRDLIILYKYKRNKIIKPLIRFILFINLTKYIFDKNNSK